MKQQNYSNLLLLLVILFIAVGCEQKAIQLINQTEDVPNENLLEQKQDEVLPENIKVEQEEKEEIKETKPDETNILKERLARIPKNYWFTENGESSIFASGAKRSIGNYGDIQFNIIRGRYGKYYISKYWNAETKEFYIFARNIGDSWWQKYKYGKTVKGVGLESKYLPGFLKFQFTGNKKIDKGFIPKELNKVYAGTKENELIRLFDGLYFKSPADWMKEYSDEKPIQVNRKENMISLGAGKKKSSLSVHFQSKEASQQIIILKFVDDPNYDFMPAIVETFDKTTGKVTKTNAYNFDVVYYDSEQVKNIQVPEKLTELPENSIIVTLEDINNWDEGLYG